MGPPAKEVNNNKQLRDRVQEDESADKKLEMEEQEEEEAIEEVMEPEILAVRPEVQQSKGNGKKEPIAYAD